MSVPLAYCYPSSFCCGILQVPTSADGSSPGDRGSVDKAGIWSQHEVHSPDHWKAIIYSVLPILLDRHLWTVMFSAGGTEAVGKSAHGPRALSPAASAWGTP